MHSILFNSLFLFLVFSPSVAAGIGKLKFFAPLNMSTLTEIESLSVSVGFENYAKPFPETLFLFVNGELEQELDVDRESGTSSTSLRYLEAGYYILKVSTSSAKENAADGGQAQVEIRLNGKTPRDSCEDYAVSWVYPTQGYIFPNASDIILEFKISRRWHEIAPKATVAMGRFQGQAFFKRVLLRNNMEELVYSQFPIEEMHWYESWQVYSLSLEDDQGNVHSCIKYLGIMVEPELILTWKKPFLPCKASVSKKCPTHEKFKGLVCSGHGKCEEGVCYCDADWFGDDCSHNVMTHLEYLPETHPSLSSSRCQTTSHTLSATRELLAHLEELYSNKSCSNTSLHVEKHLLVSSGTGSQVRQMVNNMIQAGADKAVAFCHRSWFHSDGMFHNPLPCDLQACAETSQYRYYDLTKLGYHYITNTPLTKEDESWVSALHVWPKFSDNGRGVFWFRSTMLDFLLSATRTMQQRLNEVKNKIGFVYPSIGVHVRAGDACLGALFSPGFRPHCPPISQYVDAVVHMSRLYGINNAFVAVDSAVALENITKGLHEHGIRVSSIEFDRSLLETGVDVDRLIRDNSLWDYNIKLSAFFDILLLQECDAFVGTLFSHFSKTVLELSFARKGYLVPYASLDTPWSPYGCFGKCLTTIHQIKVQHGVENNTSQFQ